MDSRFPKSKEFLGSSFQDQELYLAAVLYSLTQEEGCSMFLQQESKKEGSKGELAQTLLVMCLGLLILDFCY